MKFIICCSLCLISTLSCIADGYDDFSSNTIDVNWWSYGTFDITNGQAVIPLQDVDQNVTDIMTWYAPGNPMFGEDFELRAVVETDPIQFSGAGSTRVGIGFKSPPEGNNAYRVAQIVLYSAPSGLFVKFECREEIGNNVPWVYPGTASLLDSPDLASAKYLLRLQYISDTRALIAYYGETNSKNELVGNWIQVGTPYIMSAWSLSDYEQARMMIYGKGYLVSNGAKASVDDYLFKTADPDDSNFNSISDTWENSYFPEGCIGSDDVDYDSYSNYQEFILGSNPTNSRSTLSFGITNVAGINALSFASVTNRQYFIEYKDMLSSDT